MFRTGHLDRIIHLWHARWMVFWAYLLRCGDGSFYAGHSDDLEQRLGQHQLGRGRGYTARRRPVALAWAENFPTRLEALETERRIKGWSRGKKEALIAGDWSRVSELARSHAACPSTSSGRTVEERKSPVSIPVRPEPVEGHAARDPSRP